MNEHPWHPGQDGLDLLAAALVEALGELEDVARSRTADVGSYRYRYAELGDVLTAARAVLARHGLAVFQVAAVDGGEVSVTSTVLHGSGQYLTTAPLKLSAGANPQATGSAITYARRYALLAVLGLATEDDDGAEARAAPAPPPPLSEANVGRFLDAAAQANLTAEQTAQVVLTATAGRTTDPSEVYRTELAGLRHALDVETST